MDNELNISADIIDNSINNKVDSQQAIDIVNNSSKLPMPASFYMRDLELFKKDKQDNEDSFILENLELTKGLAKSMASVDMYKITRDHYNELYNIERTLVGEQKQYEYDEKNWISRAYQQGKKSYYGMQISKLQKDIDSGELAENELYEAKNEIFNYQKLISEIPEEKSGYVTTVGSIAASGVEFAPQIALGALATLLTGGTAGAVITGALTYGKAKDVMYLEAKNMIDEINPELDSETKADYIDTLTSGLAVIEAVGSTFGLGGLATKTLGGLIKTYGLKKTKDIIKNKSFKQLMVNTIGQVMLSSVGEATEEVLQSSLIENARPIVEQGADLTTVESLRTAYTGLAETAQRLISGQATEFDKQQWETFKQVFVVSALYGGGVAGGSTYVQQAYQNKSKAQANLKKTQEYKKARDNNTLKTESPVADKAILKNIIEANAIDGHVYLADSIVEQLISESPNNELYADAVNKMNLVEALQNSVDGMVKVDLESATETIFDGDDKLYQELEGHIAWTPDSMSKGMFDIYMDALATQVTEDDQKLIDEITAKLEPTSTPDQARADALVAFHIADALSRADTRMTREEHLKELTDKISVGDIQGINNMIVNEVEKPQTVVQKTVRKAKKVVGKVKDKIVGEKTVEPQVGEQLKLFQDIDKQRIGETDINTLAIKLSTVRNPTTAAHEFYHYFSLKLDNAYKDGVLKDYWLKRYRDAMKFAGAKYNPKTKEYEFETKEAERKGQEKLANAFTEYLLEGKSPNKQLQSFFQVMKDWFRMVYEAIKNFPRVKLNKSITRVFDSIFAKELEVETLMRAERLGVVEKPANVTDKQWQDYLNAKELARGVSTGASIKAAAELANKRGEQAYIEKKSEFYTQELAELRSQLHYQARDEVGAKKINRASIEGLTNDVKLNPKFLTKEGGLSARVVADEYGFNSITEMVDFLNNTNDTQTIAEQIATEKADAWDIEQYPELVDVKAENAVRNIALIKAQVYESMILQGIPLDRFNMNYNELILSTEKKIQGMKMSEITNLTRWQNRMNNLNEKLIVAQRKGDKTTAGKLRKYSAILNYIMLRSKNIINSKKKFDRKFDKYIYRPSPSQVKRIEGNVWDIIHSVLYNFGFTQRQPINMTNVAERIIDYINDVSSKNFTNLEGVKNQAVFLTNPDRININNISVEDFETVDGSLRILENVSKRNLSYIQDEKIREYDEDVNEIIDHYEKNKISKWNENDTVKNIFLGHIGMKETLLSRLFPERLFLKYISPFMNGLVQANKFISQKSKEIIEILKPVMKYAKREYTIDGRVFTYEQLAVIMANMGNEHNMKCMAKTLGVTEEELFSIADQSPVELRDVAQKLWDMFEENSQQFKEVVERMRGTPLKMVEAKPITFSDGQTLRGGYYPANKKANTEAKDYLEEKSLKTDSTFPTFYFEKERSDAVHKDLDTTFKTLETWVYKMAMTINVAEAYNNLSKITHSKRIENVMGEGAKKELTKWIGQATMPESVNKFIAMFDSLSSVAILGWNPIKFFIQMSGIIPAMKEVGVVPIVKEFLKTATNPYNIATAPWRAAKLSDYMNERYSHPEEHIADIRKMSWLDGGKTQKGLEWVSWIGMLVVNYGDAIAGQVTWKAMYEKSKAEGKNEQEAVSLADSMVRRTQGDTSSGSRPPILQGNFRFFNKFSSYFIGINSILSADWTAGRKRHAIAMLAVAGILAPTAEAFISALNEWEDADDEQKRKWYKKGIYSAEDYLKRKIYENSISSSASSLVPAYGIGFRTAQYWNYGKYYAPEITALTRVTNLTTMPIDVYNYLKKGDEKDYEKAFKKSFSLTPLSDEWIERILEKLSRR